MINAKTPTSPAKADRNWAKARIKVGIVKTVSRIFSYLIRNATAVLVFFVKYGRCLFLPI
jgi:hypothetical protein